MEQLHQAIVDQLRLGRSSLEWAKPGSEEMARTSSANSIQPMAKRQSVVAICLAGFVSHAASRLIIYQYLTHRLESPNWLVFVEELVFEDFLAHWKSNFEAVSSAIQLDGSDVRVDLYCLDVKLAQRTSGFCINVLRFRSLAELYQLVGQVEIIQKAFLWTADFASARSICLDSQRFRRQSCNYWINHIPAESSSDEQAHLVDPQVNLLVSNMDEVYSDVLNDFPEQLAHVRRLQKIFNKRRDKQVRSRQVLATFLAVLTRRKSAKLSQHSIGESVARLKRFEQAWRESMRELPDGSLVELSSRPVGLAILLVRGQNYSKWRSSIVEFAFKNLLMGNGVLLAAPKSLLGARFPIELIKQFHLPFELCELAEPSTSDDSAQSGNVSVSELDKGPPVTLVPDTKLNVSSDSGIHDAGTTERKLVKCPASCYAIELAEVEPSIDLTTDRLDTLLLAFGCLRTTIRYPDALSFCNSEADLSQQDCQTTASSGSNSD